MSLINYKLLTGYSEVALLLWGLRWQRIGEVMNVLSNFVIKWDEVLERNTCSDRFSYAKLYFESVWRKFLEPTIRSLSIEVFDVEIFSEIGLKNLKTF